MLKITLKKVWQVLDVQSWTALTWVTSEILLA